MGLSQKQWLHAMTDFLHIFICQLTELTAIPERWHTFWHGESNLVELDPIESAHVSPDTDSAGQDGDGPEESKDENLYQSITSRYKLVSIAGVIDTELESEIRARREFGHVDKSRTQSVRWQSVENSVVVNISVNE